MRHHALLAALAALAVLAAAAGTALAGGPGHAPATPDGARPDKRAGNHAADGNETSDANHTSPGRDARGDPALRAEAAKARVAELKAAREAALASFRENRSGALAAFHAAHNATKASFLENKTLAIEACRAAKNETRGNETAGAPGHAQCVKAGLKPLVEKARAEHQAAREAFLQALRDAREASLGKFRAAKAHADARHGPAAPQDG